MMYSERYGYNEGYFSDIEDLEVYCEDNELEMPKYVWSTDIVEISMDAKSFAETACEQSFEDAIDQISDEEIEDLQEFLDEWCARQTGTRSYAVNYKYAILI